MSTVSINAKKKEVENGEKIERITHEKLIRLKKLIYVLLCWFSKMQDNFREFCFKN